MGGTSNYRYVELSHVTLSGNGQTLGNISLSISEANCRIVGFVILSVNGVYNHIISWVKGDNVVKFDYRCISPTIGILTANIISAENNSITWNNTELKDYWWQASAIYVLVEDL